MRLPDAVWRWLVADRSPRYMTIAGWVFIVICVALLILVGALVEVDS